AAPARRRTSYSTASEPAQDLSVVFYVIAEALALHSIEMREHVAKEIAAHDAKENCPIARGECQIEQ
ncbi:MAG: hypothetical protein WBW59_11395, partial [Pseudolabrys sp.]